MRWFARTLSAPSADTDACISIIFESQPSHRYMFGCGEGTVRSLLQRRGALNRMRALFLGRIDVHHSSGASSILMSASDSGTKHFDLVGPPGLNHCIASARSYSIRTNLKLETRECTVSDDEAPSMVFKDENLAVYGVPVLPEGSTPPSPSSLKRKASRSPSPDDQSSEKSLALDHSSVRTQIIRQCFHGAPEHTVEMDWGLHNSRLPPASRATTAVSYIGVGPVVRGKFDAATAAKYGIVGPARGRLVKGESILARDGVTLVTPEMCIGPSTPASAFCIIDCPSPSYIPGVITSPQFDMRRHFPGAVLSFVVHQVGPGVLEDERYVEWMHTFGTSVQHLISSRDYSKNQIAYLSSAYIQLCLAELDSEMFVVPARNDTPQKSLLGISNLPLGTVPLEFDQQISLNPSVPLAIVPAAGMKDEFYAAVEAKKSGTELLTPDLVQVFASAREDLRNGSREYQPGDDVVITTLGTGSASPSKTRNVLSNLVQIPNYGYALLDAGEGTWGQIARRFGVRAKNDGEGPAFAILRDLKFIFISHIHGDHHMGVTKILALRRQLVPAPKDPVFLVGTAQVFQYLDEYNDLEDIGMHDQTSVRCIIAGDITSEVSGYQRHGLYSSAFSSHKIKSLDALHDLQQLMGFTALRTVSVPHRGRCYGVVMKHLEGWSLVFSGDTMPSDALVEAGKGATLLIHEASMANDQAELAKSKQHSTIGQAIEIGRRMQAKNILLTHFSQRYPKIVDLSASAAVKAPDSANPEEIVLTENADRTTATATDPDPNPPWALPVGGENDTNECIEPVVGLAFDYASISIGSMWKMSRYTTAIGHLFAEKVGGDDDEDMVLVAAAMNVPTSAIEPEAKPMGEASAMLSMSKKAKEKPTKNKKLKRSTG